MKLTRIRPEAVAAKLAAAANRSQPGLADLLAKQPRLVELLWWLQHLSMQPGGLEKFTADFLQEYAGRIGPASLLKAKGECSQKELLAIWRDCPSQVREQIFPKRSWHFRAEDDFYPGYSKPTTEEEKIIGHGLQQLGRQVFAEAAMSEAERDLTRILASLCQDVEQPDIVGNIGAGDPLEKSPWYFPGMIETLFAAMDAHAQRGAKLIAMTEVALKAFDALEYAWSEKVMVQITGDSRFGKSESVKTWAAMHPGRARIVNTPSSIGLADLYRAVADALGIGHNYSTSHVKLREMVEFTVKHSGLMFIFDESHFLFPGAAHKNTAPARLNWLRTKIVDLKLPVALVSTPQDYQHAAAKFTRASGYNLNQWAGRIVHQAILPDALEFPDLLAIAKLKCPEMDSDLQQLVARRAGRSENYIMAVEAIAKRARYIARRDGHAEITLDDVDVATAEVIPSGPAKPAAAPAAPAKAAMPATHPVKSAATITHPRQVRPSAPALAIPTRETSPLIPA